MNKFIRKSFRFWFYKYNNIFKAMDDEKYLKLAYFLNTGKKLELDRPQLYTEKLQWLKLYYHQPILTDLVDKYAVKEYVSKLIGEQYVIPTLGVWNSFDEIDFSKLPKQFVLKCTHDSGGIIICKDKDKLDINKARNTINRCLKRDFYSAGREWPYKNVRHRIVAEKYMEDENTQELRDYKFFCFNGIPKMMFVATDRQKPFEDTKFDFYDMNYVHLDIRNGHPNATHEIEKPYNFDKMKELSEILSKGFPHVRCDFYEVNGKIYFGEMTFFHHGGFVLFEPDEWNLKIGDWLELPKDTIK